ncbi:MAG TPA: DUF4390 domain-containing protein [Gallionellaceae bacterium]
MRLLFAALTLSVLACAAYAGGLAVEKAELRRADSIYQPVADFTVTLNPVVEQALTHGVALYFISEFSLVRHRWYWLDEIVAQDEQTVRLSYNALTRQYRISHGSLFQNFNNLDDALRTLGHQSFTQFPALSLKSGAVYAASVRMHLDPTQLPKPLQINALVNTDWDMDSGWYRWEVNLAAAVSLASTNVSGQR